MDIGGITLGDHVMIAPKVNIISSEHPTAPSERRAFVTANPISIANNVWIGAAATILPGVQIGEDAVIAAGAVVTKDIPARSLAAGVPARVLRTLE